MSTVIKEMNRIELVNLERLAYILKGLSVAEFETLELLLDQYFRNHQVPKATHPHHHAFTVPMNNPQKPSQNRDHPSAK